MKKIIIPLMLSLIIAGAASATAATKDEPNTKNTDIPTAFITYSTATNTPTRRKANKTTVFVNNKSGMALYVYANRGTKPTNLSPGQLYSTGTTVGYRAKVNPGMYVVKNTIYKSGVEGYQTAWLNISTTDRSVSGNCKGEWSPDTKYSYPSAN